MTRPAMARRLLACGEHAVLVELDGLDDVLALHDALRAAIKAGDPAFTGVVDVVPAARTVLVVTADRASLTSVRSGLATLAPPSANPPSLSPGSIDPPLASTPGGSGVPQGSSRPGEPAVVKILVHYDGPDLLEVSELTGLTPEEVVAAHTQTPWRVAFTGFSPGFAYLFGGDSRLQVPRRSEPRTSVPAGAVALAGEFSAVYPRSSPGGWQLLGHTDAILWDVDRLPPASLQPGSVVHFIDAHADAHTDAVTSKTPATSKSFGTSTSTGTRTGSGSETRADVQEIGARQ